MNVFAAPSSRRVLSRLRNAETEGSRKQTAAWRGIKSEQEGSRTVASRWLRHIDHDLNWKTHIEYIYNKLIKFVGIFYKLRNKLPSRILQSIYFAFIHLHLLYGIEMYASTYPSYLHELETLNNKLLRILQSKPYNSPSNNLYIDCIYWL